MLNSNMKTKIACAVMAGSLALQGCGLDEVKVPTSLIGPSELGISMEMLAIPDIVVADGIQTSIIRAVVRDQNGKFAAGKAIVFEIADEQGRTAEIGTLTSSSGARVYGSTSVTTDGNGVAQVIYTTPERRDLTADIRLVIYARPVGTDAQGRYYSSVRLDIKSAEPRRFPQTTVTPPTCSFIFAPNNPVQSAGTVLRFTSTSSAASPDYIVRYEWYFGDGVVSTGAEGLIDVQHPYPSPGTYTVTHIVTSNTGGQTSCSKSITIVP